MLLRISAVVGTEDTATDIDDFHCVSHLRSGLTVGEEAVAALSNMDKHFWRKHQTTKERRERKGFMRGERGATTLENRWSQHKAGSSDAFPNGVPSHSQADGNDIKIILDVQQVIDWCASWYDFDKADVRAETRSERRTLRELRERVSRLNLASKL